jgi:hypothetical protein
MHLCFDCDMLYEVKCGIFHLWSSISAQNLLDFGAFQISDFHIRDSIQWFRKIKCTVYLEREYVCV